MPRSDPSHVRFAGYPSPFVYDRPAGKKIQHLLWGDWLRLKEGRASGWVEVHARGCDGWMKDDEVVEDRLLEVVFVDVGQGDGCLVVTPDDEHVLIDAGEDENMFRYLTWRYGGFDEPWTFDAAIISHPDADHYGGFQDLFDAPFVTFENIYHNGIMERRGDLPLGPRKKFGSRSYLTDLIEDENDLSGFLADDENWRHPRSARWNKQYPSMLADGLGNGSFNGFRALSHRDGHVPAWGPDDTLQMEILGPVRDELDGGEEALRYLDGSVGRTKNGHSVVIRLTYRDVKLLLGGDLNIPSQELLLAHHTGLDPRPEQRDEHDALIAAARETFQVDVAKACHHGAADISTLFLAAVNPIATVISSGDDEPHAHPRADALGATGKHSRGNRPLIFSTELARSSKDTIRRPEVMKARLRELKDEIRLAGDDTRIRERLEKEFNEIVDCIDRSVAVYGAIHLRTDGRRIVMAQKLERPRGSEKWDVYRLEPAGDGPLRFVSKYEG